MTRKAAALCTDSTWVGRADCANCGVKTKLLFSHIDSGYLQRTLQPIDNIVYQPGSSLFRIDEAAVFVYSIRSGRVKLLRPLVSGGERIVRLQGSGEAVGLEAWLDRPYQNTAVALQKVDVCRIPVSALRAINRDMPQLSAQLYRQWEAALEKADFWIANLSTGPMRQRVTWLVRYLMEDPASEPPRVELLNAEDMADILGASKETVCRLMSELKQSKVLNRVAPRTYVCDLEALDRYAATG